MSMEIVFYLLCTIFVIAALVGIIFAYSKIFKNMKSEKQTVDLEGKIQSALREISNKSDPTKIAKSFIFLLKSSYVLVHLLINAGNQYNDKVQSELFSNSLSKEVLASLNSLEGKYV